MKFLLNNKIFKATQSGFSFGCLNCIFNESTNYKCGCYELYINDKLTTKCDFGSKYRFELITEQREILLAKIQGLKKVDFIHIDSGINKNEILLKLIKKWEE